jgi:2-succinyl-5-enolpyruvyl-6-hydroxy-3-cyclohexene-1-carboxylate synthase
MIELLEDFLAKRDELVVLAAGLRPEEAAMLTPALLKLGAPIVAEATANLCDASLSQLLMRGGEKALAALKPRRVLRLGAVPSWRWWRDLESATGVHVMHLANASFSGLARHQGVGPQPLSLLCDAMLKAASDHGRMVVSRFHETLKLDERLDAQPLSEPAWMRALSLAVPEGARVFLGNSLPIREWNFAAVHRHECHANRGANGIDGIVSSFFGVSVGAAESWLIVGDLSALYDLSGPWIAAQLPNANRRIVIINNGGGKIFARVDSLRALDDGARAMIENQHAMDFKPWADLWRMPYRIASRAEELNNLPAGDVIIEVRPDAAQTEAFWTSWR